MNIENAEIQGTVETAKVDSEAGKTVADGSAPSGAEITTANGQPEGEVAQNKGDKGQERFDKLTRERYEAQARAEIAEARREAAEARIAALEQQSAKQTEVAPQNVPTLEQFGFDEAKYQAALYAHYQRTVTEQVDARVRDEWSKREQETQANSLRTSWEKRESDFIKSNPDYVDKVRNDRNLPVSPDMAREIMQMELGPQIAYYLAENREKAAAIAKLPPNAQLRELGRIEGILETKKAAPPVSKAPPPVTKVDATDAPNNFKVDSADSDQLSDAEWTRRRNAQEAGRKRRA